METNKEMTVKDVLTDVNKILNDISIPVSMLESIGIPIARAIGGIRVCINAIEAEELKQIQKEEDNEPVEDTDDGNDPEDKGEQNA